MTRPYSWYVVPAFDIIPVTESVDPLPGGVCRSLWVGSAGNINITTEAGEERDDVPANAGLFPVQCTHVRPGATAPAALNIWALY